MRTKRPFSTLLRHLSYPRWRVQRAFPPRALAAIEQAIVASEKRHSGEMRFVVEGGLDLPQLVRGISPRERALEIFSKLRVWDTEENSGVLIYVGLADHQVELIADRGIDKKVADETWQLICAAMESAFRLGKFEEGALAGVRAISEVLAEHFPLAGDSTHPDNPDELVNDPLIV